MKNLLLITFVVVSIANLGLPQKASPVPEKVFSFVYSLSALQLTSIDDARAVTKVLAEHIQKKYHLYDKIEIVICKNKKELIDQLKIRYDLLVLSTEEYLSLRKQFDLKPAFTNEWNGVIGFNYLLVVNKDSQIKDISQLAGAEISVQAQGSNEIPELLLNRLLKEKKLPEVSKFFSKVTKLPSTSNVLLPIFFKKATVAMVTEQSMKVLEEINPQLKQQLKIIYRSPSLIVGMSCLNDTRSTPAFNKLMLEILTDLHKDPYGKQLLNLFYADKLVPYKDEYLKGYQQVLEK